MKGPFSFWAFFGLTLWIDILTHIIYPKKENRIDPYKPVRNVSALIPVHKEPRDYIEKTILGFFKERYPIKNIFICGDLESKAAKEVYEKLSFKYKNLYYIECPNRSKARKINYLAQNYP